MGRADAITRAFAVTDLALREFFPSDFYKRCMYAAFGMASLLGKDGIESQIIGGDVLCAVVSENGNRLNLQGFGNAGEGEPSHFWVHASDQLLDLGPMYLPYESSFQASPLPIVRWPLDSSLPEFIVYREIVRLRADADVSEDIIRQRRNEFIAHCCDLSRRLPDDVLPGAWQLKDRQSLRYAAQRNDRWAQAATEFLRRSLKAEFPRT